MTKNEIGLRRGYTGHEMLDEFGIINMTDIMASNGCLIITKKTIGQVHVIKNTKFPFQFFVGNIKLKNGYL